MKYAAIGPIAVHFPQKVETNADLQAEYPSWDMPLIYEKTGIAQRYIAAPGECASDLAVAAAEKLFEQNQIDRSTIDFVLLCTQTPDYPLPTTACLVQNRLGLRTSVGALDFNLGCSGFIYGLSLADGLIRSGVAKRVLLLTAETYSKYIHPTDRSLRTIFGDAAAATLVEASDQQTLKSFRFGTDGKGGDMLLCTKGAVRPKEDSIKPRHRHRWPSDLYMDGPSLIDFTVNSIPPLVLEILADTNLPKDQADFFFFHQATYKMLSQLREQLDVPWEKFPLALQDCGNTVSSTIPILIAQQRAQKKLTTGMKGILVGFGVGLSWAGCAWEESLPG